MVLYCFCSLETSLQDGWWDFKMCKNAFEWEILKKFAVIVSHEQIGFLFLQTLGILTVFSKNKEIVR